MEAIGVECVGRQASQLPILLLFVVVVVYLFYIAWQTGSSAQYYESAILCECSKLAGRDYLERHNRLASLVLWSLCRVHGIPCEDKYICDPILEHTKTNDTVQEHPVPKDYVSEARGTSDAHISPQDQKIKILWDFTIRCDRFIEHRRPDIVLVEGPAKKALIIGIAVPGDPCVVEKEVERWQVETEIVPVVVGTLRTVSKQLPGYLDTIGITSYCSVSELQKNALFCSAAIPRNVLDL